MTEFEMYESKHVLVSKQSKQTAGFKTKTNLDQCIELQSHWVRVEDSRHSWHCKLIEKKVK